MNVVGTIRKTHSGNYKLQENLTKRTFKIAKKELRKVFPGDKVECSITPKGWAIIEKVTESNTTQFIGRVFKSGKIYRAFPVGLDKSFSIKLVGKMPSAITKNKLVKIKVTSQPKKNRPAKGYMFGYFEDSDEEVRATEIAITTFKLSTEWNKSIIREVRKIQRGIKEEENTEIDLTRKSFVTIDGQSARDFDDAIYAEKNLEGNFVLYIAIANVSKYVEEGCYIDEEARKRGTSTYFTNKVVPMLPEIISNDICSLRPGKIRSCIVCKVELNNAGEILNASFFESLIKSQARLTYENISKNFDANKFAGKYTQSLQNINKIYELLVVAKAKRGALELEVPEYYPRIKKGKTQSFFFLKRTRAHRIIEECMLLANICAAEIILKSKLPSIYRVHPKPEASKIKQLENFLRSRGINLKFNPQVQVKELTKIYTKNISSAEKEILNMQVLQSMNQATYQNSRSEHFALGYPSYTHFTSPIRRYPDLIVHRILRALIKSGKDKFIELRSKKEIKVDLKIFNYDIEKMQDIAEESSFSERNSEAASRLARNILKSECALRNLGKVFKGIITNVTEFGIFIRMDNINVEGLCHIKNLPGSNYYEFNQIKKSLLSKGSGKSFSLGDSLIVKIYSVDVNYQRIDVRIA